MKVFDRFLVREFLTYALLALLGVCFVYLLFDVFDDIDYFLRYRAPLGLVLLNYLYSLPAYVSLLFPVGAILGIFLVLGRLVRHQELDALRAAGVSFYRIFRPLLVVGLAAVPAAFAFNEFVTAPANLDLADLKRFRIEHRTRPAGQRLRNFFYYGAEGRVYYIRAFDGASQTMQNVTVWEFDAQRHLARRLDIDRAQWRSGVWLGRGVTERTFPATGERMVRADTMTLSVLAERPADLGQRTKEIDQMDFLELGRYAARMQRAGEKVIKEDVELAFRFATPFIALIVMALAMPLAAGLRRFSILLGVGLGLLFSFVYWGAVQTTRAFGYGGMLNPTLAAWLPNLVAAACAGYLLWRMRYE